MTHLYMAEGNSFDTMVVCAEVFMKSPTRTKISTPEPEKGKKLSHFH